MKFRSGFLFATVSLFFCCAVAAKGSTYMDSASAHTITALQMNLSNSNYHAADSLCNAFISHRPWDPAGYLFRGVRLLNEMFEYENTARKDELFAALDTVYLLAESIRDTAQPHTAAWMSLWIGHAKAHKSLWESRFGMFTSALKTGLQAKSEYERGLATDATVTDLLFGLGNYHYWKSVKGGMLTSIGLLSDEREKGITELHRAATTSLISQEAAKDAFIWIWLDQKKYDKVIARCEERIAEYPNGWQFYWPLAEAYYASNKFMKSAAVYAKLREKGQQEPGNYINLVTSDYYLYLCYDALNDKEGRQNVTDQFMKYYRKLPDFCKQRRRDKIDFLRRASRL
jgi:hypothetical protein